MTHFGQEVRDASHSHVLWERYNYRVFVPLYYGLRMTSSEADDL